MSEFLKIFEDLYQLDSKLTKVGAQQSLTVCTTMSTLLVVICYAHLTCYQHGIVLFYQCYTYGAIILNGPTVLTLSVIHIQFCQSVLFYWYETPNI